MDYTIHLPSQPKVITEKGNAGMYQIDGLYPGYGHTLGNSLRRIILSSVPGAAITAVKIDGVPHEFSTIDGVKEDVVTILLNLKQIRFEMITEEAQTVTLTAKGPALITAKDITLPGQLTVLNPEAYICEVTGKNAVTIEMTVEKGLGYVPKENLHRDRVEIGTIVLDAAFTPIRRATYEVENMRVGDRTDFNRIKMFIETDGTIAPRIVLERSINTMIQQLRAIVGFQEESFEEDVVQEVRGNDTVEVDSTENAGDDTKEFLKTRIESLSLSTRTENALTSANIRTVGGLVRKKEADLLEVEGLGDKGLQEIRRALANYGIILRQ